MRGGPYRDSRCVQLRQLLDGVGCGALVSEHHQQHAAAHDAGRGDDHHPVDLRRGSEWCSYRRQGMRPMQITTSPGFDNKPEG